MANGKRIYLDVCTLCRPFDNQDMMRIRLETDAYYLILEAIRNKKYQMIVSPVHFEEVSAIGDVQERYEVLALLNKLGVKVKSDLTPIKQRAEDLYARSLGVADAVHVAFAEATADYFISCDDKLLKQCTKIGIAALAMNPVEFCMNENLK